MDNPKMFSKTNSINRAIAIECFIEVTPKFKWSEHGERVIDVGCADGSVTCILKKYVPNNYEKFVACDISQKMVDFAKEHHKYENITFRVLDIQKDIPDDLKCGFDHVVSSLTFHLVRKPEEGFKGIYDLMAPGGECVLTFFAYNSCMHIYHTIANDSSLKWGPQWLKDVDKLVSIYCFMKDPVKYVTEILKKTGFINIDVQWKRKQSFKFSNFAAYKAVIRAVDLFGMPDDVFEEFFQDYVATAKSIGVLTDGVTDLTDFNTEVPYLYELVTVHAAKPM